MRAYSTTRWAGNLGLGAGADPGTARANRGRLTRALGLPEPPRWLRQVHGARVVAAEEAIPGPVTADACVAERAGQVCAVLTADCIPVLLCDRAGTRVAVAHAGWRGLAAGVVEATVAALGAAPATLLAWLGPGIGPHAFEVGDEVRHAFETRHPAVRDAFVPAPGGRWLADLYALARQRLGAAGVRSVHGGERCTYREPEWFFSHRREGRGLRMATLIWLEASSPGPP